MLLPSTVIINKFPSYQFNFFNPISSQPYLPLTNSNKAFNLITAFLTPNTLNKAFSCFRLRWKLEKRNNRIVVRYEASVIAEKEAEETFVEQFEYQAKWVLLLFLGFALLFLLLVEFRDLHGDVGLGNLVLDSILLFLVLRRLLCPQRVQNQTSNTFGKL